MTITKSALMLVGVGYAVFQPVATTAKSNLKIFTGENY